MLISRLIITFIFMFLSNISAAQHYPLSYDNIPINAQTWEEIDITWYNKFNPIEPNTAKLLRPIIYVKSHHLAVDKLAYLHMQDIGIPDNSAVVTAIMHLSSKMITKISDQSDPVIGYFKHYVNNVKTYYFKNSTGHVVSIHATPNHPFYVENLNRFLPISQINRSMILVGKNNSLVHLICPSRKKNHCGVPYHKDRIFSIYNIEVYRRHVYRVSTQMILVHNKGKYGSLTSISDDDTSQDFRLYLGQGDDATVYKLRSGIVQKTYKPRGPLYRFLKWTFMGNHFDLARESSFLNNFYGEQISTVEEGNLYMKMMPGSKLSRMSFADLDNIPESAYNKLGKRFSELGIRHNDLHAGNLFYDSDSNTIYPIDFSSASYTRTPLLRNFLYPYGSNTDNNIRFGYSIFFVRFKA